MPSRSELLEQIRRLALEQGLGEEGARVAVAIAEIEGGLEGRVGDDGNSYGPYQFHRRGQLPAYAEARRLTVDQAAEKARTDPLDAAQWALGNYLGRTIRLGQRAGKSGAELATFAQQNGQRSQEPERAGRMYQQLYGAGSDGGATTAPTAAPETGGTTTMAQPSTSSGGAAPSAGRQPSQRDLNLQAIDETIAGLKSEKADLEAQYQKAAAEYSQAAGEYQRAQVDYEPAAIAAATTRKQAAEAEVARLRQELSNVNISIRQAQSSRATTARQAEKSLEEQQDWLELALKEGTLTETKAENQWQRALKAATLGVDATNKGYDQLRQQLPWMGNQQMADAAVKMLQGWRKYGVDVPDFQLPVIPFEPQRDIGRYLPPAEQVQQQWKDVMPAVTPPKPEEPAFPNFRSALAPAAAPEPPTAALPPPAGLPSIGGRGEMGSERMMPAAPVGPAPGQNMEEWARQWAEQQDIRRGRGAGTPTAPVSTLPPMPGRGEMGAEGMLPSAAPPAAPSAPPALEDETPPMLPGETYEEYVARLRQIQARLRGGI